MTVLYKEQSITGSQYQRANKVFILNELGQNPVLDFSEETVMSLSTGEQIKKPCGSLHVIMDPNFVVPLINPLDNEPLLDENSIQKTATLEELYVIFHSLYFEAARIRDLEAQI